MSSILVGLGVVLAGLMVAGMVSKQSSGSRWRSLADWFAVTFDDEAIHLDVRPPDREAWQETVRWDEIERVCLKAESFEVSDGLYLFTSRRPESFVIPTEAAGGSELLFELTRRGLFSDELIIEASAASEGLFCWPPVDEV